MTESADQIVRETAGSDITTALTRLSAIAADLGVDRASSEAHDLADRVAEGRFYVACVGQFKRGKSTLLNALVGQSILPAGIIPVTAVPTIVRFGERPGARYRSRDGTWRPTEIADLAQFVSEALNPGNAKGIEGVEVFVPSALLAGGMCLVDTPGLGSVFSANTEATHAFVPHVDAAIVVLGADPPISGDEAGLVETVSRHVCDLLIVINKADRVSDAEVAASADFARENLATRLGRPIGPMYILSAAERLARTGPDRDWPAFVRALEDLAYSSGAELVSSAGLRGLQRIAEQVLAAIAEERDALLRPLQESERRLAAMDQTVAEAERAMHELGYRFTAEQHRLSDLFLDRRKKFLAGVLVASRKEFDETVSALPRASGPSFRHAVMAQAQDVARHHIVPWLSAEEEFAGHVYREATQRFVEFANEFLHRLAGAGLPELARLPHALDPERGFRTRSRFYFHDFITLAQPASLFRFAADLVLGFCGGYDRIRREGAAFLEKLLEVNSSRVQSDINQRLLESRNRLEADIRILLREVTHVAGQALAHARAAQQSGANAVGDALTRLNASESELIAITRLTSKADR
jgi:GTP-binding protein EngB required for normal cell division